jgi:hypothetical protein
MEGALLKAEKAVQKCAELGLKRIIPKGMIVFILHSRSGSVNPASSLLLDSFQPPVLPV